MVLAFVCTLGLSLLSYRLIELPFLRLKNKWAPSRPRHVPRPVI
jgi:peptidoglycan/LPS O-acetylase OafA/YrhL